MPEVEVLLFGPPAMAVGKNFVHVQLDGEATCGRVKSAIAEQYPPLAKYVSVARFAVGGRYGDLETRIAAGQEVAMICMVSGG
jgi:molybdopterin converting factor small subunit